MAEQLVTCPKCGKEHTGNHWSTKGNSLAPRLIANWCFDCAFWEEKKEQQEKWPEKFVVINHNMFHIGSESDDGGFRGFGGREFVIQRLGHEEEIVSHNLWHNGDIPENFWEELPDNAVFLKNDSAVG